MNDTPITLSLEDTARVKDAMFPMHEAARVADRLRMKLEGAKAHLLDAEDAFKAVWVPICQAHGLDPNTPMQLRDDGTVVPVESAK